MFQQPPCRRQTMKPLIIFAVVLLAAQIEATYFRDYRDYRDYENELRQEDEDEESFGEDQEYDAEQDYLEDFDNLERDTRAEKDFINLALELHNKHRADHGVGALSLDEQLNKDAQAYADHECKTNVQKHSCGPCDKYGENLAYKASTGAVPKGLDAAKWAVKSWYDEVSLYDFKNPGGGDMHKWGHFTALVWKASNKMGIGVCYGTKTNAKGNKMNTVYVVARYLPPGNMLTPAAMKANVLPPK